MADYSTEKVSFVEQEAILSIDEERIRETLPYIELNETERTEKLFLQLYNFTASQDRSKYIVLNDNPRLFWDRFEDLSLPYVFTSGEYNYIKQETVVRLLKRNLPAHVVDDNTSKNLLVPIMSYLGDEAFKITHFEHHSPFITDLLGGAKNLIELGYSHERNEREKDLFRDCKDMYRNQQIGQSFDNLAKSAYTLERLLNANIPEEHRRYMLQVYDGLLIQQAGLNKSLGIQVKNDKRLDSRA